MELNARSAHVLAQCGTSPSYGMNPGLHAKSHKAIWRSIRATNLIATPWRSALRLLNSRRPRSPHGAKRALCARFGAMRDEPVVWHEPRIARRIAQGDLALHPGYDP